MSKYDDLQRLKAARFAKSEEAKPKRGRPLAKDAKKSLEAIKPWIVEGMSRRTWFRRKAAKK